MRTLAYLPKSMMASLQENCRICEGQRDMYDFTVQANAEAVEKLATLTNIRIRADDSLSRFLCGKCYRDLHKAYAFLQRCEVAKQRWQQETIPFVSQEPVGTEEEGQQSLNGMVPSTHSTMDNLARSEMQHSMEDRKDMVLEEAKTAKETPTNENRKEKFLCGICDASFENVTELQQHALTHTEGRLEPEERNFLC